MRRIQEVDYMFYLKKMLIKDLSLTKISRIESILLFVTRGVAGYQIFGACTQVLIIVILILLWPSVVVCQLHYVSSHLVWSLGLQLSDIPIHWNHTDSVRVGHLTAGLKVRT